MSRDKSEFSKFNEVMGKILTVSHAELAEREKQWKKSKSKTRKKRAKISPASRVASDC
jgi:hypothetical protein